MRLATSYSALGRLYKYIHTCYFDSAESDDYPSFMIPVGEVELVFQFDTRFRQLEWTSSKWGERRKSLMANLYKSSFYLKNQVQIIFSFVLIILSISCLDDKTNNPQYIKSEIVPSTKADTLKFTSQIRAIFQDSKGNYWFGSNEEGLAIYDGKSFNYLTTKDGLSDNQIHSFQEDKNGVIWINTMHGVNSYDARLPKLPGKTITNHTKMTNSIPQGEWKKSQDDLWFEAGNEEGVYRFDGEKLHFLAFPKTEVIDKNNLFATTGLSEGKNNMIWIATYAGVFGYDGRDFTIISNKTLGHDADTAPLHIRSIMEDSKDRLWIGNNGLGVLLKEGDSVINFSEQQGMIHPSSTRRGDRSLPGTLEHIFSIAEDNEKNIWFGDRDSGIWKYDGKSMTNYTKEDGLIDDFARSIYLDHSGKLWFGLAGGNVYTFNGKTFDKQF